MNLKTYLETIALNWNEQDLSITHFQEGTIGKLFVDDKHKLNYENFKEHKDLNIER